MHHKLLEIGILSEAVYEIESELSVLKRESLFEYVKAFTYPKSAIYSRDVGGIICAERGNFFIRDNITAFFLLRIVCPKGDKICMKESAYSAAMHKPIEKSFGRQETLKYSPPES